MTETIPQQAFKQAEIEAQNDMAKQIMDNGQIKRQTSQKDFEIQRRWKQYFSPEKIQNILKNRNSPKALLLIRQYLSQLHGKGIPYGIIKDMYIYMFRQLARNGSFLMKYAQSIEKTGSSIKKRIKQFIQSSAPTLNKIVGGVAAGVGKLVDNPLVKTVIGEGMKYGIPLLGVLYVTSKVFAAANEDRNQTRIGFDQDIRKWHQQDMMTYSRPKEIQSSWGNTSDNYLLGSWTPGYGERERMRDQYTNSVKQRYLKRVQNAFDRSNTLTGKRS